MDLKIHTNTTRELSEDELAGVAGGGQQGGPVCPICSSTNVVFDSTARKVISCNDCPYRI
jgi:hypothetical protein